MKEFKDKVLVVTGGSRGIGKAIGGTPCPRTVTGFCRCFAFRIGKIHYHHM